MLILIGKILTLLAYCMKITANKIVALAKTISEIATQIKLSLHIIDKYNLYNQKSNTGFQLFFSSA
jgi:hypothetical protein